jgi:hypothetical protein
MARHLRRGRCRGLAWLLRREPNLRRPQRWDQRKCQHSERMGASSTLSTTRLPTVYEMATLLALPSSRQRSPGPIRGWAAWMNHGIVLSASARRLRLCITLCNKEVYNQCLGSGSAKWHLRIPVPTRIENESGLGSGD